MDVYWTIPQKWPDKSPIPLLSFPHPESVRSMINKWPVSAPHERLSDFRLCPAIQSLTNNMYALKFPFEYNLALSDDDQNISSTMYNQDFFNRIVTVRSMQDRLFSLHIHYLFMCEESLEMEIVPAYLSENNFTNSTLLISGQFDIGNWARPTDCAFILKKNVRNVKISRGDDWCYVKFLTDKNITLKEFLPSERFLELYLSNVQSKHTMSNKIKPLTFWYDLYKTTKIKKILLKEVKENLID